MRAYEHVGQDEKLWLDDPDGIGWLFKPRTERDGRVQGEDWSEKVSAEIATALGAPCARLELATRGQQFGTISRNLCPDDAWELHPGSLLLSEVVTDYEPRAKHRRGHSLVNIKSVLAAVAARRRRTCRPP